MPSFFRGELLNFGRANILQSLDLINDPWIQMPKMDNDKRTMIHGFRFIDDPWIIGKCSILLVIYLSCKFGFKRFCSESNENLQSSDLELEVSDSPTSATKNETSLYLFKKLSYWFSPKKSDLTQVFQFPKNLPI